MNDFAQKDQRLLIRKVNKITWIHLDIMFLFSGLIRTITLILLFQIFYFFMTLSYSAGISQSYISQWLLQQGLEMSDSKRRAFYRWYLLERNSPGKLWYRCTVNFNQKAFRQWPDFFLLLPYLLYTVLVVLEGLRIWIIM